MSSITNTAKEHKTLTYAGYKFQVHDDGSLTLDQEINVIIFYSTM